MRGWTIFGRLALSMGVLVGTLALMVVGPYAEDAAAADPAPSKGSGIDPRVANTDPALAFESLPFGLRDLVLADCDLSGWEPFAAGLCPGDCTRLAAIREAHASTFSWRRHDGAAPAVHGAFLRCDAAGKGRLLHVWTEEDFADEESGVRVRGSLRRSPLPLIPGARQRAHLRSRGWSITVDRPRFGAVALEQLQLEMLSRGWHVVQSAGLASTAARSEMRLFIRGSEICIASRSRSEEELLIAACGHRDTTREIAQ